MNTKSEDVVKNVELNQVESTSNEQRQTVKPIVISRRRLLRAGVAGIPVVLTMAGLAPAESIQTTPSAASGLVYGGNKVYNRFYDQRRSDGLVWTDHNGFVLLPEGGVKTASLQVEAGGRTTLNVSATSHVDGSDINSSDTPSPLSVVVSVSSNNSFLAKAYQHKTGVWYTDQVGYKHESSSTIAPAELIAFIKGLGLSFKVGETGISSVDVSPNEPSFPTVASSEWYNTAILGYSIVGDTSADKDYYLLPSTGSSNIPVTSALNDSNNIKYQAAIKFSYDSGDYRYSYEGTIDVPLTLEVSGIPQQTNDDHGI